PALYPSGAAALAVAGRAAPGCVMGDCGPDGTAVGCLVLALSPCALVLVSLLLGTPFLFLQGLAGHFVVLFVARFWLVLFHEIATPGRPLLLQQWVAPRQYALVNAVGLSQHSILLALAISTSAWLITTVGSWRLTLHSGSVCLGLDWVDSPVA